MGSLRLCLDEKVHKDLGKKGKSFLVEVDLPFLVDVQTVVGVLLYTIFKRWFKR